MFAYAIHSFSESLQILYLIFYHLCEILMGIRRKKENNCWHEHYTLNTNVDESITTDTSLLDI